MAYTKTALEALKTSLIGSAQPTKITGVKHRQMIQAVLDEMFDAQTRANQLKDVGTSSAAQGGDTFIVIRSGVAYLVPLTVFAVDRATLDTSLATITASFASKPERMLVGSVPITGVKTWASYTNVSALIRGEIVFEIDSATPNACVQTFPANVKVQTNTGIWDSVAKTWTPDVEGKYLKEISYDGTDFLVKLFGPFE